MIELPNHTANEPSVYDPALPKEQQSTAVQQWIAEAVETGEFEPLAYFEPVNQLNVRMQCVRYQGFEFCLSVSDGTVSDLMEATNGA